MPSKMKKKLMHGGIPVFLLGLIMLIIGYPTRMIDSNLFIAVCLLLMVAGLVLAVAAIKSRSRY
jgi:hypothetical protein